MNIFKFMLLFVTLKKLICIFNVHYFIIHLVKMSCDLIPDYQIKNELVWFSDFYPGQENGLIRLVLITYFKS